METSSSQTLVTRNPSTGEALASLPPFNVEALPTAFAAARTAQAEWAKLPVKFRAKKLLDLREAILDSKQELAELISRENGKPIFESLANEIFPALDLLTFYAGNAPRILKPRSIPMGLMKHRRSRLEHHPLGVVAVISPWNYPFLLPFGEIAPILAAGNAILFKPSEITPLIGLKIQELLDRAGFPKGLVQTLVGDGKVGAALIAQRPAKVFFTGSVATGKKIMAQAAADLTPVNLELGGKDAMIVLDDADLDYATSAALWGGYSNSGQVCASIERILVHESIAGTFKKELTRKIALLRTGDPLSSVTDLGAITLEKQKDIYASQLDEARRNSQEFLAGGSFSADRTRLAPTLVTGPSIESLQVYEEETFGPVVALSTFKTDEEAIAKSNSSKYGLLGAIITRNVARARKIASRLEVGTVTINEVLYTAGIGETPWGGIKYSGIGRSHGENGLLEAVHVRHIHEPRLPGVWFKSPWWFPYSSHKFGLFVAAAELYRKGWFAKLAALPGALAQALRWLGSSEKQI